MKQQASVEIDRPIEEVFQYTNNNVAEWSLTDVEDEVIEEKPDRVGSTFVASPRITAGEWSFKAS